MPELKEKRIYRVEAEAVVPIRARFTVWAFDENEAAELIKKGKYQTISFDRPKIHPKQILQLFVYLGNTMTKLLSIRLR